MYFPICNNDAAKEAAQRLHSKYANPSGIIERKEASQILVDLYKGIGKGFDPSQGDVESYLKANDFNGDGRIDLLDIEFLATKYLASDGSSSYTPPPPLVVREEKMKRAGAPTKKLTYEAQSRLDVARRLFSRFDVDGSKYIDQTEVPNIIIESYKIMGMNVSPTKNDVENWMLMTDTNKDGKVSLEEYENLVVRSLQKAGVKIYED
jgi:Ca2+-binding EF-hand superfamily protein